MVFEKILLHLMLFVLNLINSPTIRLLFHPIGEKPVFISLNWFWSFNLMVVQFNSKIFLVFINFFMKRQFKNFLEYGITLHQKKSLLTYESAILIP